VSVGVTPELQPHLRGTLVDLRPLRAEDFASLYAAASDPLIWAQHPSPDRCREPVFREFFREAIESRGALLASDARDGRVIGSSRYHAYDAWRRDIEIGWTFLARSRWGGAYNGEMKQLMLAHAFRFVDRVKFLIGANNLRSRRAIERIGASFVGPLPDDDKGPRVVYEIDAATFAARFKRSPSSS
jgi:RimJ/RimL family protein N-acetyltransferase